MDLSWPLSRLQDGWFSSTFPSVDLTHRPVQTSQPIAAESRQRTSDDQTWQAVANTNLGIIYWTRGDLDHAEEMYRKSLTLFTTLGNPQMIKKVQGLLDDLKTKKKE